MTVLFALSFPQAMGPPGGIGATVPCVCGEGLGREGGRAL
jgi:hypothetical protein